MEKGKHSLLQIVVASSATAQPWAAAAAPQG